MNTELFNLMVELEYKFDLELDDYFALTEPQRNELTESLLTFFSPYINSHRLAKHTLLKALNTMVIESEVYEEYEKAEIYNRFANRVRGLTF